MYADIDGFPSPSFITGNNLHPVLLFHAKDSCLYILDFTIGFETNLDNTAERRHLKYSQLFSDLRSQYRSVTFVNLFMSSVGSHTPVFRFLTYVTPSLLTTSTNAVSFLSYLQCQSVQPTTSPGAE